jgi:SAM-dependent methyltransferase
MVNTSDRAAQRALSASGYTREAARDAAGNTRNRCGVGHNRCESATMTAEDQLTPMARLAELLQRGDAPSDAPRRRALRAAARRGVLRLMRPYTHYQRELDAEVVASLKRHGFALTRQSERIERLEQLVRELILTAESLRRDTLESTEKVGESLQTVTGELHALPYMAGEPFTNFQTSAGHVYGYRARSEVPLESSDYVAFQELFRGPAERVADLQRGYLELVRDHAPVLDLGCGRGEFLALLANEGIVAEGVDSDPGMVERCISLGLRATLADLGDHLESVEDSSLGTVFSAQVIEHLPYAQLERVIALSLHKLRPGGLFIAETVNPHCISALNSFWLDPTHEHPIFPEVALSLCAIAGFESAYVFAPTFDDYEAARFRAPAYAVVATAASRDNGHA